MRYRGIGWGLVVGVLVTAGYGVADAQAPRADTSVGMQQPQTLSGVEQVKQAGNILGRMEQAAASVRGQLEAARTARDVIKILALNDLLSQIDVATRSAGEHKDTLEKAVKRGDSEAAQSELGILTALLQKVEQLVSEANGVIGGGTFNVGGDSTSTTNIDPNIAKDDGRSDPDSQNVVTNTTPPPCASCIK